MGQILHQALQVGSCSCFSGLSLGTLFLNRTSLPTTVAHMTHKPVAIIYFWPALPIFCDIMYLFLYGLYSCNWSNPLHDHIIRSSYEISVVPQPSEASSRNSNKQNILGTLFANVNAAHLNLFAYEPKYLCFSFQFISKNLSFSSLRCT